MQLFPALIRALGLSSLVYIPVIASHVQTSFKSPNATIASSTKAWAEDGSNSLFTPLEFLSVLGTTSYTTMSHPLFPHYSVRIKKSDVCDSTVNAYTGYIDIEARHLFFYFFESRNDPATDDIIFWTNGGPGCSSSLGLFFELGPCRILDETGPKFHPESWNTNANIFFVDQPIGVGFSYADYGEIVSTSEEAAKDIAAFVAIFFENFSQFKERAFHMTGESYGGRYVPLFASAVYDQNTLLVDAGLAPINLTSMMIGNGITDPFTMYAGWYDMTCTAASVPPVLEIGTCVGMKQALPRCQKWAKESCIDQYDSISCAAANAFCTSVIRGPYALKGMNPYDISTPCKGEPSDLCYPETKYIRQFLDLPSTRSKLGVDPSPSVPTNFSSCNDNVGTYFSLSQDRLHDETKMYVGGLLERGVRVLIYAGDRDYTCNWKGNEAWTKALEWSGQDEFANKPLREWEVDGKRVGKVRSSASSGGASVGKFTFVTIEGAGHMVPYNKPKEALEMLQRWIADEEF